MQSPIDVFLDLRAEAHRRGTHEHRNAVCVSTIDPEGYPSSRFVDLKGVDERGLVFCTHLASPKAQDIARDPRAGMTMWWEHVATQIRIRGTCVRLPDDEADAYWTARSRDARLVTATFQQSRPLTSPTMLADTFERARTAAQGRDLPRPSDWGGFRLIPESFEFLEFRQDRLHLRTLYTLIDGEWQRSYLQP